ncbi:MAG: hypothetical protein JWN40_1934 [Phycisphaerales bacterium]|nr:hypothetical protein [Phycisphaerales bacterium]
MNDASKTSDENRDGYDFPCTAQKCAIRTLRAHLPQTKNPPKIPQKQLQNPPFPKLLRQRGPSRTPPSVPIEARYAHVQRSQSPFPPMHENARGCTAFSNRRLPQRRAPNPANARHHLPNHAIQRARAKRTQTCPSVSPRLCVTFPNRPWRAGAKRTHRTAPDTTLPPAPLE